ncbi:ASF1 anti-silencing function 1 [Podochytrium sp. JEL0797]|nr:ASF1 anti-silencing function 1 [Podochytrium sp. JEL0797]
MSIVNLANVTIHDNPSTFFQPFRFEITFEVISELQEDLEFKLIYVGSAETEAHDQVLEELCVGPVPVGVSKFMFEAPAPNPTLLPSTDILGVTVVLLQVSYREKEFIRVGYYVNTDYADEALRETPPAQIEFEKLERSILADKPRQQQQQMDAVPFKPDFAHTDTSMLMNQDGGGAMGMMNMGMGGVGSVASAASGVGDAQMDM